MNKFWVHYNDGVGAQVEAMNEEAARKAGKSYIKMRGGYTPDGRKLKIVEVAPMETVVQS